MAQNPPNPLIRKLDELSARFDNLREQMNDPAILANHQKVVPLSRESGQLEPMVGRYREYQKLQREIQSLTEMSQSKTDPEMAELAEEELPAAQARAAELLEELKDQLLTAEDNVVDSFFLEIRAGTGGEEAALFGRDLYEMYRRYCERKGWRFDVSDFSVSERNGFKEVIVNVRGSGAYRHLRFEGGGHRVQRVPEPEAQGRIHTSAATVAVLPALPDVHFEINPKDVEEQACRCGRPGGQTAKNGETGWPSIHQPSRLQFKM